MRGSTIQNFRNFVFLLIFFIASIFELKSEEALGNNELLDLLNTEVSTASKYMQSINEAPASVTIISHEEIQKYGYKTMAELLNSVKSYFIRNDRQYIYIGTRGFERPSSYGNKILMMINGHTCNENLYQSTFYENELGLDLDMVERVEIVQGPGSVLYGTGAVLSVINIITKKGKHSGSSKFNFEYGNPGITTYRANIGYEISNKFDFMLSGVFGSSDGDNMYFKEYDSDSLNNGLAENLDWEKHYGIFGTVNFGDFSFQTYFNRRDKSIPSAPWGLLFNTEDSYSIDERAFAELKYQNEICSNKNIMIRAYYDYYIYKGSYPYDDGEGLYYAYDFNRGTWVGIESLLHWDLGDNNRLSIGFEFKDNLKALMRVWYDDGPDILDMDNPYTVFSGYIQDSYQITEELSVTGGIRFDNYSIAGNAFTPRLGFIYNPFENSTFKVLYGESFRAPNLYEMYYYYEDSELPNPNLKPEINKTHEFIWEQKFGKTIFTTLNIYYYSLYDLIDKVYVNDLASQFKNVDRVHSYGTEIGAFAKITSDFSCFLFAGYQNSWDPKTDEKLSNSPEFLLKSGFSYKLFEKLFVSTELFFETERKTIINTFSEPFILCNFNINYKPNFSMFFISNFELGLKISNVFDDKHPLPAGFEHKQVLIEQYGRRFLMNFLIRI